MRTATDLSSAWLEMMSMMAGGSRIPPATGVPPGPFRATTEPEPSHAAETRAGHAWAPLTIDYEGQGRCRVKLTLEPGSHHRRLAVGVLTSERGKKQSLRGVTIESEADGGLVVIVPKNRGSGSYSGPIVDADGGAIQGKISVRIGP